MTVLWNNAKTALLMGGLMGLCLMLGYVLGGSPQIMMMAFVIGGAMNVVAFFYSDKIALATMRAQELQRSDDPVLFEMVERLSQKAGLPMPRVYLSAAQAPNAFATGRNPHHSAVCVTAGLRQMLTGQELVPIFVPIGWPVAAEDLGQLNHGSASSRPLIAARAGASISRLTWV